jgi:hypothetical protein
MLNQSSWMKETPLNSPTHVPAPMVNNPKSIHHYYPIHEQKHTKKQTSYFTFFIWIIVGILIMYLIHCVYTVPDNETWQYYSDLKSYIHNNY